MTGCIALRYSWGSQATVFADSGNFCLEQGKGVHVYFHPKPGELLALLDQGAAQALQQGDPFTLEEELPAVSPLNPI
jgi:hypothetical protein